MASRPDDQFAMSRTQAHTGSKYRQLVPGSDRHESVWELTWRAPVNDWLIVQPNAQYVVNPGADPEAGNAVLLGVRFEMPLEQ
jgi:carbohydrate-selective porin OprB